MMRKIFSSVSEIRRIVSPPCMRISLARRLKPSSKTRSRKNRVQIFGNYFYRGSFIVLEVIRGLSELSSQA
jgi:hypothetical protein